PSQNSETKPCLTAPSPATTSAAVARSAEARSGSASERLRPLLRPSTATRTPRSFWAEAIPGAYRPPSLGKPQDMNEHVDWSAMGEEAFVARLPLLVVAPEPDDDQKYRTSSVQARRCAFGAGSCCMAGGRPLCGV